MNRKKMIIDITMTVLMILLMKIVFTGITLHELFGIGVFIMFFYHKLINFKWIKSVSKNIFTNKISTKIKVMYIIDALLLILVTIIIISGVLISQVLFTSFNAENILFWSELHHFVSMCALMLIGIHTGLHWGMIKNFIEKKLSLNKDNKIRKYVLTIISLTIVFSGLRAFSKNEVTANLTGIFIDESKKTSDDNNKNTTINEDKNTEQAQTLNEYLSGLHCTGCSRRCPLTALKCSRGKEYLESATEQYYEEYNLAKTTTSNTEKTASNSNKEESNAFDYIMILGMFIAGTNYLVKIPKLIEKV